jgi:hypothetical protein
MNQRIGRPNGQSTLHSTGQATGWISAKLEGRGVVGKGAHGVFVTERVEAGEILAVFGGDVMRLADVVELPSERRRLALQVDDDAFLVSIHEGPADWINHSCDPNAGLRGQVVLIALRDIEVGEEVCYDYAMSDGSPYDEFACECGAPICRGQVTGEDWRRPELQVRYAGFFSAYLGVRIAGSGPRRHLAAVGGRRPRRLAAVRRAKA